MDGATGLRVFLRITLPLLAPVILVAMLLKTIWSLKLTDQVVTMTGGGPGNSTETLNFFVYRQGFSFLGIVVFTVFYVRIMRSQGSI